MEGNEGGGVSESRWMEGGMQGNVGGYVAKLRERCRGRKWGKYGWMGTCMKMKEEM